MEPGVGALEPGTWFFQGVRLGLIEFIRFRVWGLWKLLQALRLSTGALRIRTGLFSGSPLKATTYTPQAQFKQPNAERFE